MTRQVDGATARVERLARKRRPKPDDWNPAGSAEIIRACIRLGARVEPGRLTALDLGWLSELDAWELVLAAVRQIQPLHGEPLPAYAPEYWEAS